MRFFIAYRNRETNKFEVMTFDGQTGWFTDKQKAIDECEKVIESEGTNNIMLLEEISFDVNITFEK